jgi:hypothetical protein
MLLGPGDTKRIVTLTFHPGLKHLVPSFDTACRCLAATMDGRTTPCPCRVLVSTQSGRAKACARRTSRILREEYGVALGKVWLFDEDPWFQSQISDGATNSNTPNDGDDDAKLAADTAAGAMVHLILFVSTTGDGEHTVSTIDQTSANEATIYSNPCHCTPPTSYHTLWILLIHNRIRSRPLGISCTYVMYPFQPPCFSPTANQHTKSRAIVADRSVARRALFHLLFG